MKLDYTSVDDKGIAAAGKTSLQLTELSLDTTNVTDKSVPISAQAMAGLRSLNLYHTYVTEKGVLDVKAALPGAVVVFDRDSSLPNRRSG